MSNPFTLLANGLRTHCVAWRRRRNLRTGTRTARVPVRPRAAYWIGIAGALVLFGGGALIAGHARHLAASVALRSVADAAGRADLFQPLVPGARFEVPGEPGFTVIRQGGAAVVVAAGTEAPVPVRINLCEQAGDASRSRLALLRIGYRFAALASLAGEDTARVGHVHNALVLADDAPATPQLDLSGFADRTRPLEVRWRAPGGMQPEWVSDAPPGASQRPDTGTFDREGWLVWKHGAIRMQRRASASCAHGGDLLVSVLRSGSAQRPDALVTAIAPGLGALSLTLAPRHYDVPAAPPRGLEDQALFAQLQAHGLLRLRGDGLLETAPRDLQAWREADDAERATALRAWSSVKLDDAARDLMQRLYRKADGDFVRQQVAIFNAERRLLAVRLMGADGAEWQASVGAAAAATSAAMPAGASALFAELPQGWSGWTRVAQWPDSDGTVRARLTLALPSTAAGKPFQLMLAGRLQHLAGGDIRAQHAACSGRICPDRGAVRVYTVMPDSAARELVVEADPLPMAELASPGDERYRYIRIVDGEPQWQVLQTAPAAPHGTSARTVSIADRNGVPLWSGTGPTDAARAAGLATLLGIRADHANSVAGMLARLDGAAVTHAARLTIDVRLQGLAQQVLDCVGLKRGRWNEGTCIGGGEPPRGRHTGVVIIDADNGDILAAAGAGGADPERASWPELRDFDRANPAASPLRLPAWQHDGGVNNSPGSTFKVVSALGLELAATHDAQIDRLLTGMPLAEINHVASQRGFAFRTDAATYPFNTTRAHITNYRDGLLDRRAAEGRFGLAQAMTYSLNTWFAWSGELSDRTLLGHPEGGLPDVEALEPGALDTARPILAMAHLVGFGRPVRLDGGLLPADFAWRRWDALQASQAHIDPVNSRHELRQMAIGLRMQTTPLHMAMAAGAVGEGRALAPRLLLELDGRAAQVPETARLGVRLDRVRAGMKGVVDSGTAASAFRAPVLAEVRRHLYGKTGTSPTVAIEADGSRREVATVWFTGFLEPGALPGQRHRLALAAYASHSEVTGGEHAAPVLAAILATLAQNGGQNREQKGK